MFSVIIPLYNKEKSIRQTIASVLCQTYTSFELIIVNDGSTDNSLEIVRSIPDSRIVIVNKQNGGVSSARNAGIRRAKNKFVAFLDGDDLWAEYFLEITQKAILMFPNASVFSTGCAVVLKDFRDATNELDNIYIIDNYFKEALKGGVINSSCAVVDRACFDVVGYFDENLSNGEDMDMWVRLSRHFVFCRNSRIASLYCQDAENRAVGRADIPLNKRFVSKSVISYSMAREEKEFVLRGIFNYTKLQIRARNWSMVFLMLRKHHIHIILYAIKRIKNKY